MSETADTEALLQAYEIDYDPGMLANQRIAFALLFRKYLKENRLLSEATLELLAMEPDKAAPEYEQIRNCLASAWNDMEYAVKWNAYKSAGAGPLGGCGTCGLS
ncbi:hypothetical protein [Paenibacillus sp. S150]|uniref:hypothetical protein n=1 Tax=Paenibacillus sp. S150 TaxID=2749826 RepID=UPI001C5A4667|nr:hypothetical protein [Paenibacillus sp. S150]MBW4082659.1 hypothetical protein [Paenibacillus sp. S150]